MAATAGVSPSHLLLEVEVEEMHVWMYVCSVIVCWGGRVRVGDRCIHRQSLILMAATYDINKALLIQLFRLMLAN
jgi:hypothetical protein